MAQSKDETKRLAIRDSVMSVVAESGVRKVPISEIAKRAGVSLGTIYVYYPNKDEMLQSIFLEVKSELHAKMMHAYSTGDGIADGLRRLWMALFGFMREHPEMFAYHEAIVAEKILASAQQAAVQSMAKEIHDVLQSAIDQGVIREIPMDCLISAFIAPAPALARRMMAAQESDLEKGKLLLDVIWAGLAKPSAT